MHHISSNQRGSRRGSGRAAGGNARCVVLALVVFAFLGGCAAHAREGERYIIYVHGKAVEDSGRRPTTRFGVYEYDAILETFRTRGFRVLSTQRGKDADVVAAARDTAAQVRDLLRAGVPASHVTVIGASKGSVITMLASTELQNPEVRYVLLGNCNDSVFQRRDTRLSGRVLSIFEETDEFGGTCEAFFSRPGALTAHDEVHLRLGINHAFLYSPVEEWVAPATEWARHAKLQR